MVKAFRVFIALDGTQPRPLQGVQQVVAEAHRPELGLGQKARHRSVLFAGDSHVVEAVCKVHPALVVQGHAAGQQVLGKLRHGGVVLEGHLPQLRHHVLPIGLHCVKEGAFHALDTHPVEGHRLGQQDRLPRPCLIVVALAPAGEHAPRHVGLELGGHIGLGGVQHVRRDGEAGNRVVSRVLEGDFHHRGLVVVIPLLRRGQQPGGDAGRADGLLVGDRLGIEL